MEIGGLQRFSLIDYPGKLCAIVFTRGCNFRCPYCHNPELVDPERFSPLIPTDEIGDFLHKRQGKLDAVTITGGEPLIHNDIGSFVGSIKDMGYAVKIDTNGSRPTVLESLIHDNLIDYISMDVKAPLEKYDSVAGVTVDTGAIRHSIDLIMDSRIDYEFRTTVPRSLLEPDDILAIGRLIAGARRYILQRLVPSKVLDASFQTADTFTDDEFATLQSLLASSIDTVTIR